MMTLQQRPRQKRRTSKADLESAFDMVYVSRQNTLDDVDFNDPRVVADIRAVFTVLEELAATRRERQQQLAA